MAICDDDPSVRRLVGIWVTESDDLELVGEACNGLEAIDLVDRVKPDVIVMDLDMPVLNGASAIERLRQPYPDLPIVVYSGSAGVGLQREAFEAGATTFVLKRGIMTELLMAIRVTVLRSRLY